MDSTAINDKLKQLQIEDFIWFLYLGIIVLSFYSNHLERDYYLYQNKISEKKYQKIMIFIFSILCIVYFYFFIDSKKSVSQLKPWDSQKKKELNWLSLLASTLICISGILFLYIATENNDLDVELAFN